MKRTSIEWKRASPRLGECACIVAARQVISMQTHDAVAEATIQFEPGKDPPARVILTCVGVANTVTNGFGEDRIAGQA